MSFSAPDKAHRRDAEIAEDQLSWATSFGALGRKRRERAFSLVEFTAVLALMAIIAAIVTISVRPLMVKGKQDAARTEIAHVAAALESFYSVYGRYPTNEEGLAILRRKTEKLTEPLLTGDPVDPWGRAYQYNTPGREGPYEVICFGADGKPGGEGADKDIASWNLKDKAK